MGPSILFSITRLLFSILRERAAVHLHTIEGSWLGAQRWEMEALEQRMIFFAFHRGQRIKSTKLGC